ncbi:MAG: metallophosphoesterase family protein [Acidimicrobiia bacterium]
MSAAGVRDAEVMTVSPDEVVVTFVTEPGARVTSRVGEQELSTVGPHHVARFDGLQPGTEHPVTVEGVMADEFLPATVRTLEVPAGRPLATIATTNDVHFGEVECGRLDGLMEEELGPVLRALPGEPPYPETMNRGAIAEIEALDPDAVLVKGDLTNLGTEEEYAAFLAAYGQLGDRMRHVRGNHDAMLDASMALEGAPFAIDVGGVTLAVLDTVRPGIDRGQITAEQLHWLDDLAATVTGAVLVFGHHHPWDLDAANRSADYFGINPDDSDALGAVVTARENIVGYFAGHTHRNRVRRSDRARRVPFVEVSCTKDYPGVWAEYQIYEHGYTQVVRRISAPDALAWTERTRPMFGGLYRTYALGHLGHRCFTETW